MIFSLDRVARVFSKAELQSFRGTVIFQAHARFISRQMRTNCSFS
jgi:hypothetical protein